MCGEESRQTVVLSETSGAQGSAGGVEEQAQDGPGGCRSQRFI